MDGGVVKDLVREAKVGGCRLFSSALALARFSGGEGAKRLGYRAAGGLDSTSRGNLSVWHSIPQQRFPRAPL